MSNELDTKKIVEMYEAGASPYEIAEKFDTYPNKIRRIVQKYVKLRPRSVSQKLALDRGRIKHPTEGKELTNDTKIKISESVHKTWSNLTPDELQKRVEGSRQRWNQMTKAEKESMQHKALDAVRKAAKDGSKLEKFLCEVLKDAKYNVHFHRKNLVVNEKLEADIYLPDILTIIEIDGPSHFYPIWGEDKLKQVMKADAEKVGLAINKGFVVVRIKNLIDTLSDKHKRDIAAVLLSTLDKIKTKLPPKKHRLIELELK